MANCLKTKRKLCDKFNSFFLSLIRSFAESFQYIPLILDNPISLSLQYETLIDELHRIILIIKIPSCQEHRTKSPRTKTFDNIKITKHNILDGSVIFIEFDFNKLLDPLRKYRF